jgi:hypothetical protein
MQSTPVARICPVSKPITYMIIALFTLGILCLSSTGKLYADDTAAPGDSITDTAILLPDTTGLDVDSLSISSDGVAATEGTAEPAATLAVQAPILGDYTKTELRKGERLFKGLVAFQSGLHNCASCHYPSRTDTMNWNPSAYDLAVVWQEDESYSISEKLASPLGMRMMNDHTGMIINPQEERWLEAYYDKLLTEGPGELAATPVRGAIFWGLGLLMALALIDLLFTRKIKFKVLHVLVIIGGLVVHMQYLTAEAQALGRTQGYAPDQPIKFSHMIHAGENEIDCNYCHTIANFSLSAGIPSNNTCMNCHTVIREGTNSGRFEINKIHRAMQTGEPVDWVRIHKLPDHSFFSHAQHVNAGKIDCQECHGPVEEMHIVYQVEDLSMGWCLTCHRDTEVDFLGNPYYQMYESLHEDIKAGRIDKVTAARVGGEDCMKCHY